jgi:regulatory protein
MSGKKSKNETLLISYASRLLSYRPRSKHELEIKLKHYCYRKKITEGKKAINSVIEELQVRGLVDDLKFAKWWVEQRIEFSPRGKALLINELEGKGLNGEIINRAIDFFWSEERDLFGIKRKAVSENELAKKAGGKKLREFGRFSASEFKDKMIKYLMRRGFKYDLAQKAAEELGGKKDD